MWLEACVSYLIFGHDAHAWMQTTSDCIIFLKQCIWILVSSTPARLRRSTYQKDLSQASISALKSRAEFNPLNLNTTVKVQVPLRSLDWQSLQDISSLLHHFTLTDNKFYSDVFWLTAGILEALDMCSKTLVEASLSVWVHSMSWPLLELPYWSTQRSEK